MTSSATAFRAFTYVIPETVLCMGIVFASATECIGISDETRPGARKGKLTAATLTGMAVNLLMWLRRSAENDL